MTLEEFRAIAPDVLAKPETLPLFLTQLQEEFGKMDAERAEIDARLTTLTDTNRTLQEVANKMYLSMGTTPGKEEVPSTPEEDLAQTMKEVFGIGEEAD